jgi:hypothetical protein
VVYWVYILFALKRVVLALLTYALLAFQQPKHQIDAAEVLGTHTQIFWLGALLFKFYFVLTKNLFYIEIKLQMGNFFYKIQQLFRIIIFFTVELFMNVARIFVWSFCYDLWVVVGLFIRIFIHMVIFYEFFRLYNHVITRISFLLIC